MKQAVTGKQRVLTVYRTSGGKAPRLNKWDSSGDTPHFDESPTWIYQVEGLVLMPRRDWAMDTRLSALHATAGLGWQKSWRLPLNERQKALKLAYEGCPEIIQPFRICREPVVWPWCNLAASLRRPCCASVNSHSPVGLVGRQWDAVDWACVLCDRRIHNDRASRSASSWQCACPSYSSRVGFFSKATHRPGLSAPVQSRFGSFRLFSFPKTKIVVDREEICECDGHTVHKLSQRRLIAQWLVPQNSNCSQIHSKISSDWLPSHIKATRPVLEIFKMAGYFPDSPRIALCYLVGDSPFGRPSCLHIQGNVTEL